MKIRILIKCFLQWKRESEKKKRNHSISTIYDILEIDPFISSSFISLFFHSIPLLPFPSKFDFQSIGFWFDLHSYFSICSETFSLAYSRKQTQPIFSQKAREKKSSRFEIIIKMTYLQNTLYLLLAILCSFNRLLTNADFVFPGWW